MEPRATAFPDSLAHLRRGSLSDRWIDLLPLLVACAAAGLMRWPGLWLPLERDEGAYGLIAALWLEGRLPYRDLFDHKPPLIYLLYMPPVLLGTPGAFAIRTWSSLLFLLQLPLVFMIGRRAFGRASAGLAVLLYAVAGSAFSLQGLIFNTEQALVLPALGALWALVRGSEDQRLRWPALYGFALGLVTLIKPVAVPLLLPLVLLGRRRGMRGRLWDLAAATAGTLLPWLPVLGDWAGAGALRDLRFALIDYNRIYAAESVVRWTVAGLVDTLAPLGPLLVCAVGGVALAGRGDRQGRQRLAVVLWTAAFVIAATLGLRPYIHYYYPVLPGLALLAAPTVTILARRARRAPNNARRLVAAGGPALLLALLLLPFAFDNLRLVYLDPTAQAEALYGTDGEDYFGPASTVAAYVREATLPGQEIFVWASEPEIYFLSGRSTGSRYIYDYPLGLLPEARAEVVRGLLWSPPALVITYRDARPDGFVRIATAQDLRLRARIGGYDIWAPPATRSP